MGRPKGSRNKKTLARMARARSYYAEPQPDRNAPNPNNYARETKCNAVQKDGAYFRRYDSIRELLVDARQVPLAVGVDSYHTGYDSWSKGHRLHASCDYVERGATHEEMKPALALIDKVDASFRDRDIQVWTPSICGAYPIVADYLMGIPDSMRMRKPLDSDVSPIRLVIESAVSAGVSEEQLKKRGAALAALVMRMCEARPVELWVCLADCGNMGYRANTVYMARLNSTPVSMSETVAVLGSIQFMRIINFSLSNYVGQNSRYAGSGWAFGSPGPDGNERSKKMRKVMDLDPQDILIQAGFLPDASLLDSDPVAWVHKQLEKQRSLDV